MVILHLSVGAIHARIYSHCSVGTNREIAPKGNGKPPFQVCVNSLEIGVVVDLDVFGFAVFPPRYLDLIGVELAAVFHIDG